MAGTVVEIETGPPQRNSRERIYLRACGALGKNRAGNGDMALEDTGEAVAHQSGWLAHRESAGDIGCAVLILAARINQKYPLADLRVGLDGHTIMRNGGIGAGGGDGRKRNVLQLAGVAAEGFERLRRFDLAEISARRMDGEPMQKVDHRGLVPQMRIPRAFEFGRVLARLHRDDRILAERAGAAGLFQDRGELRWRRGGIEQDFLALFAKSLEVARKTFRLFNIGDARGRRAG